jgi:hypothetical protein
MYFLGLEGSSGDNSMLSKTGASLLGVDGSRIGDPAEDRAGDLGGIRDRRLDMAGIGGGEPGGV